MSGGAHHVLFLCTGNSARSIIAEALLNHLGGEYWRAFSAGSHPTGRVHPLALDVLGAKGVPIEGLESQSWADFAAPGAAQMDIVITVCNAATSESCPAWPGRPVTAHWGLADPAAFTGTVEEKRRGFTHLLRELERRIQKLTHLPWEELSARALEKRLDEIGEKTGTPAGPDKAKPS